MTASAYAGNGTASRSLPHWLETYTTYALVGVLALPLGLSALYEGYRRYRTASIVTGGDS